MRILAAQAARAAPAAGAGDCAPPPVHPTGAGLIGRLVSLAFLWATLPRLPLLAGAACPEEPEEPATLTPARSGPPGAIPAVARTLLGDSVRIFVRGGNVVQGTMAGLCGRLLLLCRSPGVTWVDIRRVSAIATAGRAASARRPRYWRPDGCARGRTHGAGHGAAAATDRDDDAFDDPPLRRPGRYERYPVADDVALPPACASSAADTAEYDDPPPVPWRPVPAPIVPAPAPEPVMQAPLAQPAPEEDRCSRRSRARQAGPRRPRLLYQDGWRLISVVHGRCPCR